jgi:hypothetical protein
MVKLYYHGMSTPRGEFIIRKPSTSSSSCELRPDFIAMVQNGPFSRAISDDRLDTLEEFEELWSCEDKERLRTRGWSLLSDE